MEGNKLSQFLVVACKLRCHDSKIGPYDAIKLMVKGDGTFSLLVYDQMLKEGCVKGPLSSSSIVPVLDKLANPQIVVSIGIQSYSEFKASIGYDLRRVVPISCPPDSVRNMECQVFYEGKC